MDKIGYRMRIAVWGQNFQKENRMPQSLKVPVSDRSSVPSRCRLCSKLARPVLFCFSYNYCLFRCKFQNFKIILRYMH